MSWYLDIEKSFLSLKFVRGFSWFNSFRKVLLNHLPQVGLVNMNALLENLRIFASVGIMSAKVILLQNIGIL